MTNSQENKVKIRFKFKTGEEFEAEGSPEFIAQQRADFLQIIGKEHPQRTPKRITAGNIPPAADYTFSQPTQNPNVSRPISSDYTAPLAQEDTWVEGNIQIPAIYRQEGEISQDHGFHSASRQLTTEQNSTTSPFSPLSAAENTRQTSFKQRTLATAQELRLLEQLVRIDNQLVILRRKSRQLSADTAALLLLAAAQVLLKMPEGYSALALSKSLKKSGYGGERLDRVLGGELKQGNICSEGSKRSRLYRLSDKGFARAYVLADKLAAEL